MTQTPLKLFGTLRQSDAEDLRQRVLQQIEAQGLAICADGLEAIEVGPLQVLLCAAQHARQLGLPCQIEGRGVSVIDACLASVRLPAASQFFNTPSHPDMSVQQ